MRAIYKTSIPFMSGWLLSLWSGKSNDGDDTRRGPPPSAPGQTSRAAAPSTEEAARKLKVAISATSKSVRSLSETVDKRKHDVRTLVADGSKQRAAKLVPLLKADERRLDTEQAKLTNLRDQLTALTGVQDTVMVVDAFKASTAATRAQMGGMGVDEIENIMEDSREQQEAMGDINALLASPLGASSDQAKLDELEAEQYLDQLMQATEEDDHPPAMPSVPRPAVAEQPRVAQQQQQQRRLQYDDT